MKIVDAKWTPKINYYKIECYCGLIFYQRVDRFKIICPKCGHLAYKDKIKISLRKVLND
jgi:hypothetical protein